MILIKCSLVITLLFILIQDYKHRAVSWVLFPIAMVLAALPFFSQTLTELYILSVISNLIITAIMLLGLILYARFKLRTHLLSVIGMGDLLFFLAMSFAFAPISYLTFMMFGLLFSLVIHWIVSKTEPNKTVPLAGYLSAYFAIIYLTNWLGFINGIYSI